MAKFWYDTFELPAGVTIETVALPDLYASGKGFRVTFQTEQEALALASSLEKAATWLRETALEVAAIGPHTPPEVDEKVLAPRAE